MIKLAEIYVCHSAETAHVERKYSEQNLVINKLRNKTLIQNMSDKVCTKNFPAVLGDECVSEVIHKSAKEWCSEKDRKIGKTFSSKTFKSK